MLGLYQTDIKFSICLILLIMQIWTPVYYTETFFLHLFTQKDSWTWNESVLPVQPAVLVPSCLDIFWGLEKSCTLSGLPVTVWHEYKCGRGAGEREGPQQMGWGLQGRWANMCDAAWPAWRLLTFHPRTPRRGIIRWNWTDLAAMLVQVCVWCLSVPASVVTWDVPATRNLSLSTYKSVGVNCWDSFINYATNITSDVIICWIIRFVLFYFGPNWNFLDNYLKDHPTWGRWDPLTAQQFRTVFFF